MWTTWETELGISLHGHGTCPSSAAGLVGKSSSYRGLMDSERVERLLSQSGLVWPEAQLRAHVRCDGEFCAVESERFLLTLDEERSFVMRGFGPGVSVESQCEFRDAERSRFRIEAMGGDAFLLFPVPFRTKALTEVRKKRRNWRVQRMRPPANPKERLPADVTEWQLDENRLELHKVHCRPGREFRLYVRARNEESTTVLDGDSLILESRMGGCAIVSAIEGGVRVVSDSEVGFGMSVQFSSADRLLLLWRQSLTQKVEAACDERSHSWHAMLQIASRSRQLAHLGGVLLLAILVGCSWGKLRVVDEHGEPIAGAEAEVRSAKYAGGRYTTDADGRCHLTWPHWDKPRYVALSRGGYIEKSVHLPESWPAVLRLPRHSRGPMPMWYLQPSIGQSGPAFEEQVTSAGCELIRDAEPDAAIPDLEARVAASTAQDVWLCKWKAGRQSGSCPT